MVSRPLVASILLRPAPMPLSETILIGPIEPELSTWTPAQSSLEYSPMQTTLTFSPYFSPNRAMAPMSRAYSWLVTRVLTETLSSQEEARDIGAIALFGEKYGEKVRV